MRKLSFTNTVLAIVIAATLTLSLLILIPAYQSSMQVLEQEQALSHRRHAALIDQLFESHLQGIARSSATLAQSPQLIQEASSANLAGIRTLLQKTINSRGGEHIQAFAVQLKDGPLTLVPGAALFNVYLPLAELVSRRIVPDTWATLTTRQKQQDYQLLRLSLPIIAAPFGEVVGYLHSFVILNDNFWILNQIQSISEARAIALYTDNKRIGALSETPDQLQILDASYAAGETGTSADAGTDARASQAAIPDDSIVQRHSLFIEPDNRFEVRLLLPDHAGILMRQAFAGKIGYGLLGALVIGALLVLVLCRLAQRPIRQLSHYLDAVPGKKPEFRAPSPEMKPLANAVQGMLQRLQENEHRVTSILSHTSSLIFLKDSNLRYRMINPACARAIGLSADQIIGLRDADLHPDALAQQLNQADQQVLCKRCDLRIEYSIETADRGRREFLGTLFPILNSEDQVEGIGGVILDVTEYRLDADHLKLTDQVFNSTHEAILVLDRRGNIITANAAYLHLSGFSLLQVCGQPFSPLVQQPQQFEQLEHLGQLQSEAVLQQANGALMPIWLSVSCLQGDATNSHDEDRYVALFSDISRAPGTEQQLELTSRYDSLTGLPNRQQFCVRLDQILHKAAKNQDTVAVLFVDIDGFKSINESLGPTVGDQLLRETARRIEGCLESGETLARLGGDEFSIILDDIPDASSSHTVARSIQQAFQRPFVLADSETLVTCSIGISLFPDDASDAHSLLAKADTTAHHVKQQGRNAILFFDSGVNQQAQQHQQLNDGLRRAQSNGELFLQYQPRFDIDGQRILGAEALLRWRHPEQGLISPFTFITLAEESGMILELGPWALQQACAEAVEWNSKSPYPIPVSVNLSPRQLRDPELIPDICDALRISGLAPELLELEITESVVIDDINRILGTLYELRDMGISLSIDDFGTGYSSLAYLKKLPVNTVKIDRSFVIDIPGNADDENLIEAIITMAHSLRFKVVAEGIETAAQQAVLKKLGCDELQGFLLARPGSCAELIELARNSHSNSDALSEILLPR
ncbi:EAL domain-containing protein [Marinobacterium sedimentorum]|uniref:EAL domain-containing protein n=1 Tax=Marinobacterium sedimentorum TaxID=2927804 RepID=UPI0020C6DBBF|nr:EAL domain-containing protein [Marinobacterium sedimentorum]MCP8687775.1 EAL domain-containing protein [Marinobacterium sedimentorum]